MDVLISLILLFVFHGGYSGDNDSKFKGCSITRSQKKFDVLPGFGWDSLEETEKGRVLNLKFSECRFSEDNKYLIPDEVSLLPLKSSEMSLYGESFDHYINYTSITSKSMKIKIGIFLFSSQFSDETFAIKNYQLNSKSKIVRVQSRYKLYRSKFEPDAPLSNVFKDRILYLANWIKDNNETLYSSYLADMIIRDFGTHVIRTVDAGGVLYKIDILKTNYIQLLNSNEKRIHAFAKASFENVFKFKAKYESQTNDNEIETYRKSIDNSITNAIGGTTVKEAMKLDDWIASINDNLAPIDRSGDPIYHILNEKILPGLHVNIIHRVSNLLQDSVNRYYLINSIKGCLNFSSPNFNSDANVDGGHCDSPLVDFSFGGLYETCEGRLNLCNLIRQVNYLTGRESCPDGFFSVLLHSGEKECQQECERDMIFWKKCRTECPLFKIFWCYPETSGLKHKSYRFGGFINEGSKCPEKYTSIRFGSAATLCVTKDALPNDTKAIRFGGFYSCSMGNPLAQSLFNKKESKMSNLSFQNPSGWLKGCPSGYIAHLATIEQNCQILFCAETNKVSLGAKPVLKKLPIYKVSIFTEDSANKYLYTENGKSYVMFIKDIDSKSKKVTIVTVVLILGCSIAALIIVFERRRRRGPLNVPFVWFSRINETYLFSLVLGRSGS